MLGILELEIYALFVLDVLEFERLAEMLTFNGDNRYTNPESNY